MKIALIGHSGSGKSSCLGRLAETDEVLGAEMDEALGTRESPSLAKAAKWLLGAYQVVVVSVHEQLLRALAEAKLAQTQTELFAKVRFVYLRNTSREERRRNLCGTGRKREEIRKVLGDFWKLDPKFRAIADVVVDTTGKSPSKVAEVVGSLLKDKEDRPPTDKSTSI